ncbi:hypothetical protein PRIC2_009693 [Phytophthora ramorum]
MAVDLIQFWVSMIDIVTILDDVNALMAKIPRGHPTAKETFVQVAVRLLNIEAQERQSKTEMPNSQCKEEGSGEAHQATELKKGNHESKNLRWIMSQKARVFPFQPSVGSNSKLRLPAMKSTSTRKQNPPMLKEPSLGLELVFSQEERTLFIQKCSHVLFITEYLVLVEYVEMVLPFIYCLHQFALFHMHNGAYYPTLAGISSDVFSSRMLSTLLYSLFQFFSFVMLVVVLKRKLGFSSLQQLAFVLDVHAGKVQTKLNLIFVYIMQVPLAHHGADFSFKFSWLTHTKS